MRPLLPLALLILSAVASAEPSAKLEQDRDRESSASVIKGQWFDLLLIVDPKGEAIAEAGLEAQAAAKGGEFAAAIFPAPDQPGAFTKPFTIRIPVKLAAAGEVTATLTGKTAKGAPLTVRASAKQAFFGEKIHVSATLATKAPAVVGRANAVVVTAKVMDGYHVYGTEIDVGTPIVGLLLPTPGTRGAPAWTGGGPASPKGKELEGSFSFEIPFTPTRAGKVEMRVLLDWQACTELQCDPNAIAYLPLEFDVEGASGAGTSGGDSTGGATGGTGERPAGAGSSSGSGSDDLGTASLLRLILLSIGAGIFALLMPCTYPLIPITISFFSKQAEARHGKVLPLALAYGAGIVAIFTVIGLVVGGGLAAADSVANLANVWWLNFLFAVLFLVFGLSLVGLFDIRLPSVFDNVAAKASGTGGYLSVFAMGLTLVVTSFTCTAPFVGSLLVFAAKGGQLGAAVLCMAVFGLTMAVPFAILAMSPKGFQALPRSGEWMKRLKVTLGIIELGLVLKFLSNVDIARGWFLVGRELFLVLWSVSFLAAGLYLLGVFGLFAKGARQPPRAGRAIAGVLLLGATGFLAYGVTGARLGQYVEAFLPSFKGDYNKAFVAVVDDYEQGLKIAKEKDAFVFLHFTGFQ